jgi:hypothetical protein
MKKHILFILILVAFSMAVPAQTKRIAILETIDKEDKVPYAIEVMVRSNLTKVISNTEGYEGYDRVNISQIMDEHEFERTGLVNEDQIRQLGEIAGADYLLVSEAVKFDESNIFVTAKILNVESAKTEGSENSLMGITAYEIQSGCESLANRLLGLPDPTVHNQVSSSNSNTSFIQQNAQQLQEQPIQVPVVAESIKIETPNKSLSTNPITRQGKTYYQDGKRLSNEDYVKLLQSCPQAVSRASGGLLVTVLGSLALGGGLGGMLGGIIEEEYDYVTIGGLVALGSIPVMIIGGSMQRNAYKVYNRNCAQSSATLGIYPTANGMSICLSF